MTSVTGHVCDRDGIGVPEALIAVLTVDGAQVARGRSDAEGRCQLALPRAGTYLVVATARDWQPVASCATVGDDQDPTVELRFDVVPRWARPSSPVAIPPGAPEPAAQPSGVHGSWPEPLLAQVAVGLTAALLATRLLSDPGRYPTLVAAAARLAPPAPSGDSQARARQAAREVLLPSAVRLLAPLVHGAPSPRDQGAPADKNRRNQ